MSFHIENGYTWPDKKVGSLVKQTLSNLWERNGELVGNVVLNVPAAKIYSSSQRYLFIFLLVIFNCKVGDNVSENEAILIFNYSECQAMAEANVR